MASSIPVPPKRLLIAVKANDLDARLIETAVSLARVFDATLHVLHVGAPEPEFVGYKVGPWNVRDDVASHLREEHRAIQLLRDRLEAAGCSVGKIRMVQGAIAEAIVKEAIRLETEMILLGYRQHSGLHHLIQGDVTEEVVKHSPCPVLVIPE